MNKYLKHLAASGAALALGVTGLVGLSPQEASAAPSKSVVINEVYGGGGNSGATYKQDFIELYNLSSEPVSLDGWVLNGQSTGGSAYTPSTTLSGTIQPGDYFLVSQATGNDGTQDVDADLAGAMAIGAKGAAIELVNADGTVIDLVGWGGAKKFEGKAAAGTKNDTSIARKDPKVDTDNNADDFSAGEPTPQKSGSAGEAPRRPKPRLRPRLRSRRRPRNPPKPRALTPPLPRFRALRMRARWMARLLPPRVWLRPYTRPATRTVSTSRWLTEPLRPTTPDPPVCSSTTRTSAS